VNCLRISGEQASLVEGDGNGDANMMNLLLLLLGRFLSQLVGDRYHGKNRGKMTLAYWAPLSEQSYSAEVAADDRRAALLEQLYGR
jgi:hypothetical protein